MLGEHKLLTHVAAELMYFPIPCLYTVRPWLSSFFFDFFFLSSSASFFCFSSSSSLSSFSWESTDKNTYSVKVLSIVIYNKGNATRLCRFNFEKLNRNEHFILVTGSNTVLEYKNIPNLVIQMCLSLICRTKLLQTIHEDAYMLSQTQKYLLTKWWRHFLFPFFFFFFFVVI